MWDDPYIFASLLFVIFAFMHFVFNVQENDITDKLKKEHFHLDSNMFPKILKLWIIGGGGEFGLQFSNSDSNSHRNDDKDNSEKFYLMKPPFLFWLAWLGWCWLGCCKSSSLLGWLIIVLWWYWSKLIIVLWWWLPSIFPPWQNPTMVGKCQ